MLVLSRKCEQSVMLGDDIVVTVLGVEGDRVKLGIRAPRGVNILRHEIYQQLQDANAGAAKHTRPSVHSIAAAVRAGQKAQVSHV
jgi:carbon storage regulator